MRYFHLVIAVSCGANSSNFPLSLFSQSKLPILVHFLKSSTICPRWWKLPFMVLVSWEIFSFLNLLPFFLLVILRFYSQNLRIYCLYSQEWKWQSRFFFPIQCTPSKGGKTESTVSSIQHQMKSEIPFETINPSLGSTEKNHYNEPTQRECR